MTDRKQNGMFDSPAITQPITDSSVFQPASFFPFGYGESNVATSESPIITFVTRLIGHRIPLAIRWFIIAIHINAFQCEVLRTLAHVGVKVRSIMPTFADFDSPSTIVRIRQAVNIITSSHHITPRMESLCFGQPVTLASTPTTSGRKKVAAATYSKDPAHATAEPINTTTAVFYSRTQITKNCQIAKGLADNVYNRFWLSNRETWRYGKIGFGHWLSPEKSLSRGFRVFTHPAASIC